MNHIQMHDIWGSILVGLVAITIGSLVTEPTRQKSMAIILAGASGSYFNDGLGIYEIPLSAAILLCAGIGLRFYPAIGVGWLLHTTSDVLHHSIGQPIISFLPTSSIGCAVCDVVLAVWFFMKAPSVFNLWRRTDIQEPSSVRETTSGKNT
ncbi:DUF6010 family protein [Schlesneria sp. T3-172]|uniref:DUF6010 family protein n=1 Tax=Schlesneria sphaerica TaxID=3373610 RepID=UPI0037C8915B